MRVRRLAIAVLPALLLGACVSAPTVEPPVAPPVAPAMSDSANSAAHGSAHEASRDSTAGATPTAKRRDRFYKRVPFGSESEFNPLTEFVNEGTGILQTQGQDQRIFRRDYALAAHNVLQSILHPGRTYSYYGWSRALRNEWLPLTASNNTGGGAWVPNYEYHFIGGGMVALKMEDWYADHDVPHPALASAATFMGMQFFNEILENGGLRTPNEDATTDLLIFDPAALIVWRWGAMQRLFSGPLELTNWAAQPILDLPSQTLQNAGQQYVLRARIPGLGAWRAFYYFNMTTLLGLSHPLPNGASLSIGAGADAVANPVVDPRTGAKGATLRPKAGIFYDRDGSLLWSLQVGSRRDIAVVNANIYPGVVRIGGVSPGFVVQMPRHGGVRLGLVAPFGLGVGYGPER